MGCFQSRVRENTRQGGEENRQRTAPIFVPVPIEITRPVRAGHGDISKPHLQARDSRVKTVWLPSLPEVPQMKKHSLVIAIDFGTTYSAYGYAHLRDKLDIKINKNWEAEGCSAQYKTPTCLCVQEDNPYEIYSFGLEAQHHYNNVNDDETLKGLHLRLFEEFKMRLYAAKFVNRDLRIPAKGPSGFSVHGLEVFAMAIKFLKNHCLKHLQETGCFVNNEEIRWVLTVPAIWKDVQKMFMREATVKAGIIQDVGDRNLVIALEPEAASVFCRFIYNTNPSPCTTSAATGPGIASNYAELHMGDTFMVIDAGGGTIDITAYESLDNGKCKEIISPVGGAFGGKLVNETFKQELTDVLGKGFMDYFLENYQSALSDIMLSFEMTKRKCKENLDEAINVQLDYQIFTAFEEFTKTTLEKHFTEIVTTSDLQLKKGKLKMSPTIQQKIFKPVVQHIVKLVANTIVKTELRKLTTIFLVGGFGQCAYLENQLKQIIKDVKPNVQVLRPEEPSLCVLRGAVMCGANPMLIESRIAPRTYLILAAGSDGSDELYPVIEKGQSIPHGFVERRFAVPQSIAQTYVTMYLYTTEKPPPYKLSNSEMIKVCDVNVNCTSQKGKENIVEFEFMFGGTEIVITCIHKASKTKIKTAVDFLCSH